MPRPEPRGCGGADAARGRDVSAAEGYRGRRRLRDRSHQGSRRTHLRGMRHLLLEHVAGLRRLQGTAAAGSCDRQHGEGPMMDRPTLSGVLAAGLLAWQAVALAHSPARTEEFGGNDLPHIRLGFAPTEMAEAGYVAFYCASDPNRTLASWKDWSDCPD